MNKPASSPGYEPFIDRFHLPETTAKLVKKAQAMAPVLRDRADDAERRRAVHDETIADLVNSGLFRIMQPAGYGGFGRDFADYIVLAEELGSGCPSTSWIYANVILKTWMIGMFAKEAQDDVWAEDENTIVSSILRQTGVAEPVKGGYRLRGKWSYVSGVDHTGWTIIGAMRQPKQKDQAPLPVFHLVPRRDYTLEDNWHVVGLVATGSKNIIVDGAFVPEHRTLPIPVAQSGRPPGLAVHSHPVYRVPLMCAFGFFICAPLLGMAKGAMELFLSHARGRPTLGGASGTASTMRDLPTIQTRVAEGQMRIDAARACMLDAAVGTMQQALSDDGVSGDQRIMNRRAQCFSSRLATEAVDDVFNALGAGGLFLEEPLQRYWRDAHAGAAHFGVNWDALRLMCGQHALGLDPDLKYY